MLHLIDTVPFGKHLTAQRYRLENGLKVVIMVDPSAPVVSYHTWFGVGSRHETPGKTGLAHLFEHLMFIETTNHPQGDFDRLIEAAGGSNNAATWVDWTYYYENVPRDALSIIMELEADRMSHLILNDEQVRSEKDVVTNERKYRVDDDVEGMTHERLCALAFRRHGYGWPTIGWMEDIQAFTTEDCLAFYRTYYAPNNATVVIVGDVHEQATLSLIEKLYGEKPSAQLPPEPHRPELAQRQERHKTLRLPAQAEKLVLAYKAPEFMHPKQPALTVLSDILFGGRSGRLPRRLINELELCTQAHGSVTSFAHPGLFEIWLSMRPTVNAQRALDVVEEEFSRMRESRVSDAELEKVRNQLELSALQEMETAHGKAEQIGFYETVTGHTQQLFSRLQLLREVTAADVQDVAQRYLKTEQRTRITVIPEKVKAE